MKPTEGERKNQGEEDEVGDAGSVETDEEASVIINDLRVQRLDAFRRAITDEEVVAKGERFKVKPAAGLKKPRLSGGKRQRRK